MALLAAARGFTSRLSTRCFALAYSLRTLEKETGCSQVFKTYMCSSVIDDFKIRLIETEEEFESIIINAMAKEGWRPGLKDAECFVACDPTGTFVGELNGKPVCCINFTKYGDSFALGGCHIVKEEYRGKRYGGKILNAAMASVKPRSIGMVSALQ